jgi:hypothetical protein
MTMLPYEITYADYSTIYNALSFVMASMMASTVRPALHHKPLARLERRTPLTAAAA